MRKNIAMGKHSRKGNVLRVFACFLTLLLLFWISPSVQAEETAAAAVDVEALFLRAMQDRDAGNFKESILGFHSILSSQPLLHRARLELAVAYYKSLQYQESLKQAQKVLDDPDTPPNVRVAVLAFMAQAKSVAILVGPKSYWNFPVSLGYLHDSNVNVGPSTTVISGLGELDPTSGATTDTAKVITASINHNYQTGKMLNWGHVPAMFFWQSGVNVYHRGYFDEDDYDLDVISLRTGPALITKGKWRANLSFQEDIIRYGEDKLADYQSIMPSVTLHFPYAIEATLDASFTWREFDRDIDNGRDSHYAAPRISVGYVTPDKKISFQVGYQYFDENADGNRYTNNGYNIFSGFSLNFIENGTFYFNYNYRDIEYDGTVLDLDLVLKKRNEGEYRYTAGCVYTFKTENILNDWSFDVKSVEVNHNSDVILYDYNRTQLEFTLSKIF